MQLDRLTAKESLELITQIIEETKSRFEENGFIYVFWGILIACISSAQFVLLYYEYYAINWYPYMLVPFGLFFSIFYYAKKRKQVKVRNQIDSIIYKTWVSVTLNMVVLGFVFAPALAENLSPIILILLSIGMLVSAISLKSRPLFISSIFINVSAIVCFNIDWMYQPLALGAAALLGVSIPGFIMMRNYKKRKQPKIRLNYLNYDKAKEI